MQLHQFVEEHPDCEVARPDLVLPGAILALLTAAIVTAVVLGVEIARGGQPWWTVLALAALALLARPWWRWAERMREVRALRQLGHACFAVDSHDILLVDAIGNSVVVALDRITALEIDGDEVRLRTDAEEQGIIYAITFQLFDESVPGPSPSLFFDVLAPRLRQSNPGARVVRVESDIGALTTRA